MKESVSTAVTDEILINHFAQINEALEAFLVGLHRLFIKFDTLWIGSLDQPGGGRF